MTGCPVPDPTRENDLILSGHTGPHLLADGPHKAGELACERGHHNRRLLAFRDHGAITRAESCLCLPGDVAHALGKTNEDLRFLFSRQLSLLGSYMGTKSEFAAVLGLIAQGKFKPVVDRVFPLAQGAEAHRYLAAGQQFGKVVLKVD